MRIYKTTFALFLLLLTGLPAFAAFEDLPHTRAEIVDHDPLGIWLSRKKDFETAVNRGAKIVYLPQERTFFTYWIPPGFKSGRIMVSVHGTGGNPYIAIRDEMEAGAKFDYMTVAVSWFSQERGFYSGTDLYRIILEALNFIREQTGNDLSAVAYVGFSRGSAVSYEVAYLDAKSENIFDFFISHSGGIPMDLRVEAKNPGAKPDAFFSQLTNGKLGKGVFKGKNFFLYSGDKDEHWGPTMSLQMENAKRLIEENGGRVVEWARDPEGGHMGFLKSPEMKAKAIRYFMELTSPKS